MSSIHLKTLYVDLKAQLISNEHADVPVALTNIYRVMPPINLERERLDHAADKDQMSRKQRIAWGNDKPHREEVILGVIIVCRSPDDGGEQDGGCVEMREEKEDFTFMHPQGPTYTPKECQHATGIDPSSSRHTYSLILLVMLQQAELVGRET
ncbi:hypothetical protein B0H11DRAFT_2197866 [Mycena galericulata]|nr:hypothetical protein B0H11DRAFT_2197866 [Mycena galericulata]